MGNSTNQLGDQPGDFRCALDAIEWVTLPDHVELGFFQLTDQTLDLYPNPHLCYSNNCSHLDVISVGPESVNVESQINSSCINEFDGKCNESHQAVWFTYCSQGEGQIS